MSKHLLLFTYIILFFLVQIGYENIPLVHAYSSCRKPLEALTPGLTNNPSSLKTQIARISRLKAEGKELRLIIGRTNTERNAQPALPDLSYVEWIYGDIEGDTDSHPQAPIQLTMDFANEDDLIHIESNTFSQIIVDWSTWKFLASKLESIVDNYSRILKDGGSFIFGQEVAGGCIIFHKEVPEEVIYNYHSNPPAPTGYQLPFKCILDSERRNKLRQEAQLEMASRYDQFFRQHGFRLVIYHENRRYPVSNVHSNGSTNYFELIK